MVFSLVLFSIIACEDGKQGFSSLGQTTLDPNDMMQQTGSDDSDTGDQENVNGENPDAPMITEAIAFFDQVTGQGDSIEIHLMYEDPQDDVLNGYVDISYFSSSDNGSQRVDINGFDAVVEEGEITMLFIDANPSETYSFNMVVTDAAGNVSNSVEAAAIPVE
jgi:hypothetical protein